MRKKCSRQKTDVKKKKCFSENRKERKKQKGKMKGEKKRKERERKREKDALRVIVWKMVRSLHHQIINFNFYNFLNTFSCFFLFFCLFLSSCTLAVEIQNDEIVGKEERIYFWGEKDSVKSSNELVELSSVQEIILSLDTLIDFEKVCKEWNNYTTKIVFINLINADPTSKRDWVNQSCSFSFF